MRVAVWMLFDLAQQVREMEVQARARAKAKSNSDVLGLNILELRARRCPYPISPASLSTATIALWSPPSPYSRLHCASRARTLTPLLRA